MGERSFDPIGRGRRLGLFLAAVGRRFYTDHCLRHASALAYTTLLSLVPLLALMFSILKGLGVQRRLEPILLSRLALDPAAVEQIIGYIDRINVGTLGALGAAALVLTVISVLGAVEATLNQLWRVRRGRTIWRKATDYLSVFLLTPMLLLAGVAITSSVQQQQLLRLLLQTQFIGDALLYTLRLAPIVMNAVALGIVYAVMPNRRPRPLPIIAGALAGGVAWQLVQWAYVSLQIGMASYNAIYGALSQLPITLVWLYVSWVVVLLGAELAVVLELGVQPEAAGEPPSRRTVALYVLLSAAQRLRHGGEPIAPPDVVRELAAEGGTVAEAFDALAARGWIVAVEGERPAYVLAREPASIQLAELPCRQETVPDLLPERARRLLSQAQARERESWAGRTLADLVGAGEEAAAAPTAQVNPEKRG
jgi:membrane protein